MHEPSILKYKSVGEKSTKLIRLSSTLPYDQSVYDTDWSHRRSRKYINRRTVYHVTEQHVGWIIIAKPKTEIRYSHALGIRQCFTWTKFWGSPRVWTSTGKTAFLEYWPPCKSYLCTGRTSLRRSIVPFPKSCYCIPIISTNGVDNSTCE